MKRSRSRPRGVANLLDELSILVAPVADGGMATPTLFDAEDGPGPARRLRLLRVERRRGDLLWARYRVARQRARRASA